MSLDQKSDCSRNSARKEKEKNTRRENTHNTFVVKIFFTKRLTRFESFDREKEREKERYLRSFPSSFEGDAFVRRRLGRLTGLRSDAQWVYRVSCIRRGVVTRQEVLMIPLLIRWTLACNYQAWWGSLDERERERESVRVCVCVGMYTRQDIISSSPPSSVCSASTWN